MGTVSNIIGNEGIKQPRTSRTNNIHIRTTMGGISRVVTIWDSSDGRVLAAKKKPNSMAALKMKKDIDETFTDSMKESVILFKSKRSIAPPMTKAPTDPIAPASVAVNMPAYRPPITNRNKAIIGADA